MWVLQWLVREGRVEYVTEGLRPQQNSLFRVKILSIRLQRSEEFTRSRTKTYQADALSEGLREGIEVIDGRVKLFCQRIIAGWRSIEFFLLLAVEVRRE